MAYATYAQFSARYQTRLPEAEVSSHFLPQASARLDAALAPAFTVPFSSNNVTARDLTIDLAYLMILQRSPEPRDRQALAGPVERRLAALRDGREAMVTTSGEALYARGAAGGVWSSTRRFRPVFDLRDAAERTVDPDRLRDAEEGS